MPYFCQGGPQPFVLELVLPLFLVLLESPLFFCFFSPPCLMSASESRDPVNQIGSSRVVPHLPSPVLFSTLSHAGSLRFGGSFRWSTWLASFAFSF